LFLPPMLRPPHRSLNRSFLALADTLPAVPLAESLLSSSCRHLARRAAGVIAVFFLLPTPYPPRRLLHRSFPPLADFLSRAGGCIIRFFLFPTACPSRRSLHRSFLSPADATSAAPLAASFVSFSYRRVGRRAVRCIGPFFLPATPAVPLTASLVSFSR
jgi:hypothetical protein